MEAETQNKVLQEKVSGVTLVGLVVPACACASKIKRYGNTGKQHANPFPLQ